MDLDLNGILKMHAVEKKTGNNIDFVIENAMRQFSAQELEESKKRLESLWDSDGFSSEKFEESTLPTADVSAPEIEGEYAWLVKQAEEKLGSAHSEDRDEIVNLIADLKNALDEKDDVRAKKVAEELEDILFYIG